MPLLRFDLLEDRWATIQRVDTSWSYTCNPWEKKQDYMVRKEEFMDGCWFGSRLLT